MHKNKRKCIKHNCELDKFKKTMVDKRTFNLKKPRGKLESYVHEGVMLESRFSPQVTQNEDSSSILVSVESAYVTSY